VLVLNPGKDLAVSATVSKPCIPIERIGVTLSRHLA